MGTNNGCPRSRNPINNRALHQPGLNLMLASRACWAPPRNSHVWPKHMEWALSIGTLIKTIRSILVYPKEKTPDAQKCGLVYQVECPECPLTYMDASYEDERPSQPQEPSIKQLWENTVCTNTTNNKGQC